MEVTKGMEAVKIKGGFMGDESLSSAQVKSLANLPPLPVMRAQLLGVLQAPASKLVRTLAEPGRPWLTWSRHIPTRPHPLRHNTT